jgi:RNA-binding protein YlmH
MNKNELIKKYVQEDEDKILMARVLDKLEAAENKNILERTKFLNDRQLVIAENMLINCSQAQYIFFGGFESAKRKILIFLPDYMEVKEASIEGASLLAYIRADYSPEQTLSHRDFLGSLMGSGIKRETIGDILVGEGSCDIVILKEILPYLLSDFESVGRVKVRLSVIQESELQVPEEKYKTIKDTVASLRLDSVVSTGFAVSREKAAEGIRGGKVSLNSLECAKTDKLVAEGDNISWRGMGKIKLQQIGKQTKKGRTAIVVQKYI